MCCKSRQESPPRQPHDPDSKHYPSSHPIPSHLNPSADQVGYGLLAFSTVHSALACKPNLAPRLAHLRLRSHVHVRVHLNKQAPFWGALEGASATLHAVRRTPHAVRRTSSLSLDQQQTHTTVNKIHPRRASQSSRRASSHDPHPALCHSLSGPWTWTLDLAWNLDGNLDLGLINYPPLLAPCLRERHRDKKTDWLGSLGAGLRPCRPGPPNGRQGCVGTRGH